MPERVTAHASPVIGERARAKPPVTTERIRILPKADRIPADPVVEKVDYDRAVAEDEVEAGLRADPRVARTLRDTFARLVADRRA